MRLLIQSWTFSPGEVVPRRRRAIPLGRSHPRGRGCSRYARIRCRISTSYYFPAKSRILWTYTFTIYIQTWTFTIKNGYALTKELRFEALKRRTCDGERIMSQLTCFPTLRERVSDMAEVALRLGRKVIKYDRLIKPKEVATICLHAITFYFTFFVVRVVVNTQQITSLRHQQ